MYLVKSCFQKDNVFKRQTIRIGSLNEYRNAEAQIKDAEEGTYNLVFELEHVHLTPSMFKSIFNTQHSMADLYIEDVQLNGYSPIFKEWYYCPKIYGATFLSNFNRFVFCISLLDSPSHAKNIFKEYDDIWYFKAEYANIIALEMAKEIKSEIIKKQDSGFMVFEEGFNKTDIEVRYQIQRIDYRERKQILKNAGLYNDIGKLPDVLSGIRFIKPETFSHEKEIRFCFDVFEKNKILHPKDTNLIINAERVLSLLKK